MFDVKATLASAHEITSASPLMAFTETNEAVEGR